MQTWKSLGTSTCHIMIFTCLVAIFTCYGKRASTEVSTWWSWLLSVSDGEGVCVHLDRFDPGRESGCRETAVPTTQGPGEIAIPYNVCALTHYSDTNWLWTELFEIFK